VEYCANCAGTLHPLESYQGVMEGVDTLICPRDTRVNDPKNKYFTGCGYSLLGITTELKSKSTDARPRAAAPRRFQSPAPARGTMLVARETYDATDPVTHKIVHVMQVERASQRGAGSTRRAPLPSSPPN
jgi:hypothetical protein